MQFCLDQWESRVFLKVRPAQLAPLFQLCVFPLLGLRLVRQSSEEAAPSLCGTATGAKQEPLCDGDRRRPPGPSGSGCRPAQHLVPIRWPLPGGTEEGMEEGEVMGPCTPAAFYTMRAFVILLLVGLVLAVEAKKHHASKHAKKHFTKKPKDIVDIVAEDEKASILKDKSAELDAEQLPKCVEEEMEDFPRRMREWLFNVMQDLARRHELNEPYKKLEEEAESLQSRQWVNAVIWKFCELDSHPHDRAVSRHELFPLRAPLLSMEHCIAPFLNGCDKNDDHTITLKEWGECLGLEDGEVYRGASSV
ncbi:hypothetical protein HPB50_026872 [Hyalomma asiaticum]|uniref:Uncharacterized protein n=1 Tax=Hyalomma asiaticum TaxID=266040 RepID=A0ACB7TRC2_HYAAI|nr:hypothetical protein HPB50_026872 [Hyalomma asiaticum]